METEDYEWEYELNEDALPEIDPEIRKRVLNAKHNVYKNTVYATNNEDTQNNRLIDKYLKSINMIYVLSLNIQNKNIQASQIDLSVFPEQSRESLQLLFDWLERYFRENTTPDTIPYEDYIRKNFHEYPYIQSDNFGLDAETEPNSESITE